MRDLGQYVSDLLHRHDCVIVPGFGGILANYRPASIHPTQHLFQPPSKRLVFNRSLTGNDGLLANHIASLEQVNYKTALDFIEKEVSKIVHHLQLGEKVQWNSLPKAFATNHAAFYPLGQAFKKAFKEKSIVGISHPSFVGRFGLPSLCRKACPVCSLGFI